MAYKIKKAVFPVAGLGTRFLPVTKAVPKEMLPVLNKPLVQYAIEEAHAAGIEEILFVNGRGKNALEDFFDHSIELEHTLEKSQKMEMLQAVRDLVPKAGNYAFVRQTQPLGFGHAVLCAKAWVGGEPFAVLLPDDMVMADTPCLKQMTAVYDITLGNMATVVDVPRSETAKYGILAIENEAVATVGGLIKATSVVEKPAPEAAPSTQAIIGRYILHPQIFDYLERQTVGVGGEIQLTDALKAMIPQHGLHGFVMAGHRFDCGSVEGMLAAQIALGFKVPGLRQKVEDILKAANIYL